VAGQVEKPCHTLGWPQTQPRDKARTPRHSRLGAVHSLYSPEPVFWEETAHKNVIFINQVLLLQGLQD
jgi:hypothetical protein